METKRIGKYELEEFLGGGMSLVYKARDTVIGRTVAIKILTQAGVGDPESKARFLREAQMAGNLAHENIMSVYDFGEDEGQPYMVMEFLRGEDLRSAMKNGNIGDLHKRLQTALQVAKALEYIHQQKIIHRDIKPENIHINASGAVKLMDFGIARTDELRLTRPGFTPGTPYYMAPEQVVGKDVTPLADIYSFGMLLYELLTLTKAIEGDTVTQIFYKILNEPVNMGPLREARLPESILRLIEKCIAKNPIDRPQSMSAVQLELERALMPERPPTPTQRIPQSHGKRVVSAVITIVILLAIAIALFITMRNRNSADSADGSTVKKSEPSPVLSTPTGEMVLISIESKPAFYIDRTEVTNEAYARFCKERQRPLPPEFRQDRPDYPVVNITIVDAQEFGKWAQKRLPNRIEWEMAARGHDRHAYPWGDSHDPSFANVADNKRLSSHELMPVYSFKPGASPYGVMQMAGNAWEFVDELITPSAGAMQAFAKLITPPPTADEPWYTMCGGSFDIPLVQKLAVEWSAVPARHRAQNIGFRCAKDIPK
jgi:eukaryotic-like serine/threonine-protein kinase